MKKSCNFAPNKVADMTTLENDQISKICTEFVSHTL